MIAAVRRLVFGVDRAGRRLCAHAEATHEYHADRVAVCACGRPRGDHTSFGYSGNKRRGGTADGDCPVYRFCHWRRP